ncbi:MAG: site-2 protease family protein [Opitutales bacterium]
MFGKGIKIFTLLGFEVRLDPSWFLVALLVTWSLAVYVFPGMTEAPATTTYWIMGVAGALGLFLSIILHELGHALVARRQGIEIGGITLFIFGGVAQLNEEPKTARDEFFMAMGGPVVSVGLAFLFYAAGLSLAALEGPAAVSAVLIYLGAINGIVVLFNMVPAFPLDGGRVLRAALWGWKKDLRSATRIASRLGAAFGLILIGLGVVELFLGSVVSGFWLILLGLFLRAAAASSFQQVMLRESLRGEPVRAFMSADPIVVHPAMTVRELIDDYIYTHHHKLYPVMDDGELKGCVTLKQVKEVPREERDRRTVGEIAVHCDGKNTIQAEADAVDALSRMSSQQLGRLIVFDQDRVVGILSMKDLQRFFALKVDLAEAR